MVQSPWREEASFATLSRAGHSTCAWNGKLLVFGGRMGAAFFSDVWAYDPAHRCWELWCDSWPHAPRSYHSTNLAGGEVWLCGGSGTDTVLGEVMAFDPVTRRWRTPTLCGDLSLLRRTAHGACLHPARSDCILLQGGYGGGADSRAPTQIYSYLSDLVELNTRNGVVRALRPAGTAPEPRAYHSLAALGACCYVLAGRTASNRLAKGKAVVVAYNAAANRWVMPGVVGGELAPRSSHRTTTTTAGILLFGGAIDRGAKAADLQLLVAGVHGQLSWRQLGPPSGGNGSGTEGDGWPAGRGAHAVEELDGRFYVLGGYGEGRQYIGDCWSISLEVVGGGDAAPPASLGPQRPAAAKPSSGNEVPEAPQWREARRRSRPAAASGSELQVDAKRQRVAAASARQALCVAAAAAAAGAAGSAPAWELAPGQGGMPEAAADFGPTAAATAPPSARQLRVQWPRQQVQQQVQQPLPTCAEEHLAQLQAVLQQQQVVAAAREQLLADLQQETLQLRAHWEGLVQERQAAELGAQAAAQQHGTQIAELQDQLLAAQRDRDGAQRGVAAAARAEEELRSQQRRERDTRERDELERDRFIDLLKKEVAHLRHNLAAATDNNATQAKLLDVAREDLGREQRAVSEARKAQAEECKCFTRSLQEQSDLLAAAQQSREMAQALLEMEQRAYKEAVAQVERQNAQLQEHAGLVKRGEEVRDELQRKADELRGEVQRLQGAEERWRAGKAAVAGALAAMQRGMEAMP